MDSAGKDNTVEEVNIMLANVTFSKMVLFPQAR